MAELVSTLLRWLQADRVRASPNEGTLYRLTPSSVLFIDGRTFEVLARRVETDAASPLITYDCNSGGRPCQLRVAIGSPRLTLVENHCECHLSEDDVEVFHV